MGTEIERKFLVKKASWKHERIITSLVITQGYLSINDQTTIRVRKMQPIPNPVTPNTTSQNHYAELITVITIKGKKVGLSCPEYEYEIPVADAEVMLGMCGSRIISKTRFKLVDEYGQHWDLDIFHDKHRGLVLAERELEDIYDITVPPDWLGDEVTTDCRYSNAYLATQPEE